MIPEFAEFYSPTRVIFGPGIVSKLVDDDKVEVLFRNAGRKLLHLQYTTLEKI